MAERLKLAEEARAAGRYNRSSVSFQSSGMQNLGSEKHKLLPPPHPPAKRTKWDNRPANVLDNSSNRSIETEQVGSKSRKSSTALAAAAAAAAAAAQINAMVAKHKT